MTQISSPQDLDLNEILSRTNAEEMLARTRPFLDLMMRYNCAVLEVKTKFEVLNQEFSVRYNRNPVESIKTRIKKPMSIMDKLNRNNLPLTLDSIWENITDVAGIRIICSFPKDIYTLSSMFLSQDDVTLLERKDYIQNPKPNGYRSLHLIVRIPVFLTDSTVHVPVEVQFRTIALDFWASIEHQMKYKKKIQNSEEISQELRECAGRIAALDQHMQEIQERIVREE